MSRDDEGDGTRKVEISGAETAIEEARQLIESLVGLGNGFDDHRHSAGLRNTFEDGRHTLCPRDNFDDHRRGRFASHGL